MSHEVCGDMAAGWVLAVSDSSNLCCRFSLSTWVSEVVVVVGDPAPPLSLSWLCAISESSLLIRAICASLSLVSLSLVFLALFFAAPDGLAL